MSTERSDIGKRIGTSTYLHRSSLHCLSDKKSKQLTKVLKTAGQKLQAWNVIRISEDSFSFLMYADFESEPFPKLEHSCRIDLFSDEFSFRDYSSRPNPPILHRKELLVADDFPNYHAFLNLTQRLEELGVFYDVKNIGYQDQWFSRLAMHGIKINGYEITVSEKVDYSPTIQRHRAAISRQDLSKPVQARL